MGKFKSQFKTNIINKSRCLTWVWFLDIYIWVWADCTDWYSIGYLSTHGRGETYWKYQGPQISPFNYFAWKLRSNIKKTAIDLSMWNYTHTIRFGEIRIPQFWMHHQIKEIGFSKNRGFLWYTFPEMNAEVKCLCDFITFLQWY